MKFCLSVGLAISWEAFPQPELREEQALLDKAHRLLEDA